MVIVVSGKDGKTIRTVYGNTSSEGFGHAVSRVGDINRDGHADILVATSYEKKNGHNSGEARLLSGRDGSTLFVAYGANSRSEQLS
jgi:hypothetical protein